jgi:hypothetical protein
MIARHWKGIAKRERANEYFAHLENDTFKQIATMDGFISANILTRDVKEGIEFLIRTEWESLDAIRQFAGPGIETAVVPPLVRDIMINYDAHVSHYEVIYSTKPE